MPTVFNLKIGTDLIDLFYFINKESGRLKTASIRMGGEMDNILTATVK